MANTLNIETIEIAIESLNETYKENGLPYLRFNVNEKQNSIMATFVSQEDYDSLVGHLDNLDKLPSAKFFLWVTGQIKNMPFYKTLVETYGKQFNLLDITDPYSLSTNELSKMKK